MHCIIADGARGIEYILRFKAINTESVRNLLTLDTTACYYFQFRAILANNTPSSFATVRGVPSHSSMLTRSFMMVSRLETDEKTEPYSHVVLRR